MAFPATSITFLFFPFLTVEGIPAESQPNVDHVTETHKPEDTWTDNDSVNDYHGYNSWEDEVDDLIAWTNTLDTDNLD